MSHQLEKNLITPVGDSYKDDATMNQALVATSGNDILNGNAPPYVARVGIDGGTGPGSPVSRIGQSQQLQPRILDTLNPTTKLPSLVFRLNRADRTLLDRLSSDYAESIVTIMGKSLRLYRAIVEAVEQGGTVTMTRIPSLSRPGSKTDSYTAYETVVAVREQFADKDKTPITLNRAYINVSKGLKTERIAIRAVPAVIDGLAELEHKTGLSKSAILRDSMHLYNFLKRESETLNTTFYIGDALVEGI